METENTLKLQELFEETAEAEQNGDARQYALLTFEQDAILDTLTPAELRTHMLFLITRIENVEPDDVIDEIARRCGSREPEDQNTYIAMILQEATGDMKKRNDAAGAFPLMPKGPKGLQ